MIGWIARKASCEFR